MADPRDHVGAGRYAIISKLGEGGMGAVFRAHDRLTGEDVAVKRLIVKKPAPDPTVPMTSPPRGSSPTEYAGPATADDQATVPLRAHGTPVPAPAAAPAKSDSVPVMRLAIASEFRILASLRHPNIISVLDYGFDERHDPFLVLEVLEQAHTITSAARAQPLRVRIAYVAQILQALAYLHRRGIRHRDLKPSNVMVTDGRVRVLDFGLALEGGERHRPAGTFGYIAPEVLRGEPHTAAADLYAAGILAFEVLAGFHPFGRSEEEVLRAAANPPKLHLDDPSLSSAALAALSDTVERLLSIDPLQRPSSANQALRLLGRTGVLGDLETEDQRRSMVAAARLVGRGAERSQLRDALSRARKGQGGVVALVGESGVGKSRLVDDLRTHALVSGCSVVIGGEVAGGGGAYASWQDPLRRIALEATPAAPVPWPFLTLVVQDIGELIGIGTVTTPVMDPQTLQILLMQAVEALIRAVKGPTVILLEDMHWAGPESIALLGWMSRAAAQLPLLILVTTRPEGAASVSMPGVQVLHIGPLERRDVEEMAVAVLGPLGDRADLIDLLVRGTGGVPLYVVEALRLLAAQAGTLEDIGTMRLPSSLTIDVLDSALRDRLGRLAGDALSLCQLAALVGPDLDLAMLAGIAPELDLTAALTAAEQAGVLVVDVGGWHFSHERVREVLIEAIPDGERPAMHRRIGEWLDKSAPVSPRPTEPRLHGSVGDPVALARHWGLAGDRAREAACAAAAADALLTRAAYLRARSSFRRALELLDDRGLTGADRDRAELQLQLGLGTCTLIIDGFSSPATAAAYDRAAALVESLGVSGGVPAFMVLFGQSTVHLFRGDIESSVNLSQRALRVAQEANDVDLEIEGRFALSNAQFWFGQLEACEENIQRVLALWSPERAGLHMERFGQIPRVTCMTGGAWGAWAAGRPDQALKRAEESVAIARQHGHNFSEAIAVQIVAFVTALRRDVDATLMEAEALVRYGAPYPAYMILARTLRAWALAHRERDLHYLDEMRRAWADWRMIGQGAGHTLMTGLMADSLLLFGQVAEALDMAREGIAWVEARHERPLLADLRCLEGRALHKQGDVAGARAAFAAGAAAANAIGAHTLALRVAVAWATLEYDQGDFVEARARLVPALERMREGADTIDMISGLALLARLEERKSQP